MKAIQYHRFGGPDVLQMDKVPDPQPGPGQVRIALRAASVVPADWKVRAGQLQQHFKVTFPKIPGRDGAGIVTATGPGVDTARVGDPVYVTAQHTENGTYAEAIVRDAATVVPKPAALAFEETAALMHAGLCAWLMLVETARIEPGMKVLVHAGAGAIGGLAVQLAAHLGADVAATCRASNLDYVRGLGARTVIAYDRDKFEQHLRDYDIVVDLMGGAVHDRSYAVLRRGGHMVYLIAAPFEDRSREFGVRLSRVDIRDRVPALQAVARLAENRVLRPQVSDVLPLASAAEAHRRLEAGQVTRGRLVLRIGEA
jgi:NADPH:quinone reductase-like Zn-dependent oxidoreductase